MIKNEFSRGFLSRSIWTSHQNGILFVSLTLISIVVVFQTVQYRYLGQVVYSRMEKDMSRSLEKRLKSI